MKELLERLRAVRTDLNSGLSSDELDQFSQALGHRIPEELAACYRDHNGMCGGRQFSVRLMSASESIETSLSIRKNFPGDLSEGASVHWTDDNSNCAGVFSTGRLASRVFLLDHEEPDDSPRFRSVKAFVEALVSQKFPDFDEVVPDYPALDEHTRPYPEVDRDLARLLLGEFLANPDTPRTAYHGIALSAPSDSGALIDLLKSADLWVQARAIEVLGVRRYAPAIGPITESARRTRHNPTISGITALQRIGTPEALAALQVLEPELGSGYSLYFRRSRQA